MSRPEIAAELEALALDLADAAGPVTRQHFRGGVPMDAKADESPVTIADREAERVMRELLLREVPEHGIIGEEHGRERDDAEYVWVLDPIDGTKAFITGKPTFTTLIALLHRGVPVLGVIDQPVLGDRWLGVQGKATRFRDGESRSRQSDDDASLTLSTTGPQYLDEDQRGRFEALAAESRVAFVSYGGDGYQYGLVASGHIDLVVEANLKLHDFAALVPVVAGAGGVITDWAGRPLTAESDGTVIAAGGASAHALAVSVLG